MAGCRHDGGSGVILLLGILYAAVGAFTFALNNVAMRRGVVTGSVLQGMAVTVPIGGLSFLIMAIMFGELYQLALFPVMSGAWLAGQGIVHFVLGRYCNYKSNQPMGVNLTAPVVQLQVRFAMLLAVVMLHEKFTALQAIGSPLASWVLGRDDNTPCPDPVALPRAISKRRRGDGNCAFPTSPPQARSRARFDPTHYLK